MTTIQVEELYNFNKLKILQIPFSKKFNSFNDQTYLKHTAFMSEDNKIAYILTHGSMLQYTNVKTTSFNTHNVSENITKEQNMCAMLLSENSFHKKGIHFTNGVLNSYYRNFNLCKFDNFAGNIIKLNILALLSNETVAITIDNNGLQKTIALPDG